MDRDEDTAQNFAYWIVRQWLVHPEISKKIMIRTMGLVLERLKPKQEKE